MTDLTDTERVMLDFEKITWRYQGRREEEIRRRFGISGTRHAQMMNTLIDRPEALTYAPSTVKRLRRLRDQRRAMRRAG